MQLAGACLCLFFTVFAFLGEPCRETLSALGADRRILFFLLCLYTGLFFILGSRAVRIKSRALVFVCAAFFIVGATQSRGYIPTVTQVHWLCALMFFAAVPCVLLREALRRGRARFFCFACIFIFDLIYAAGSVCRLGPSGANGAMELLCVLPSVLLLMSMRGESASARHREKGRRGG